MFLGLDIGTSVVKAALFDAHGEEVGEASERMVLRPAPPGWSELDGEAAWDAVARVVHRLVSQPGLEASRIRGVGVAGVMVGAWLVDANGDLVRPPILWNDARAQGLVDGLAVAEPNLFSKVFARSGSMMQLGCVLPVLAWLQEHEPEHLARAAHVLCAKDFIRFRLTGAIATDESEAAMAPGSAAERMFDAAQLDLLGVSHLAHLLPPVRKGETLAGAVTPAAALATGLVPGTPVAVGTGDTSACVIGTGCCRPGQAATVLGTTCLNGVLFGHPAFEPADVGLLFILPGRLWMKTMVNVAGTTVLDWCLSALCPDLADRDDPYRALGHIAQQAQPGAGGAVFVPYLSANGVIAPRIEPGARAGFHGLAPQHGRADLVRAVYEGMAYAVGDCFSRIGGAPETIRLSGGGARSPLWGQMIADVCGVPVEIARGTQFGAKGAALCAATATGAFASIQEASAATFRLSRRHEPDAGTAEPYAAGFERFRIASAAALNDLARIAAVSAA